MPQRPDALPICHSFPSDFPLDTDYLTRAMAEHNSRRTAAGLSEATFFDLDAEERRGIIDRAQDLKNCSGTAVLPSHPYRTAVPARGWVFIPWPPSPEQEFPWWVRGFFFIFRLLRYSLTGFWF